VATLPHNLPVGRGAPASLGGVLWTGLGFAACLGAGALAAYRPAAAAGLVALALGLVVLAVLRERVRAPFAVGAFTLVGGYVVLTRGFSGLHLPLGGLPLYIGELTMPLLAFVALRRLRNRWLGAPAALLLAWMALNLILTLPHLEEHGVTAIRDAATWYYGVFALIGAATWRDLDAATARRWLAPIFVLAVPASAAGILTGAHILPEIAMPLSDAPVFADKYDTNAMYLIAATVLFVTAPGTSRVPWPRWLTPLLVASAVGLIAAMQHRAAFIGLAGVLALLLAFRLWRPVLLLGVAAALLIAGLWLLDVEVETGTRGVVSARAIVERQLSTLDFLSGGETARDQDSAGGTIRWRTVWWRALLDEQLADPALLLFGRGYGPDLRDAVLGLESGSLNWDQGVEQGKSVRSPHNIALTIFARSGVIGLGLWLLLLGTCSWRIVRATVAARRAGQTDHEMLGIWLASFLLVVVLVSLLGVVLEAPFGAAPFYFVLGLGVAWTNERARSGGDAPSVAPSVAGPSERTASTATASSSRRASP
jgi:hypothetical protein